VNTSKAIHENFGSMLLYKCLRSNKLEFNKSYSLFTFTEASFVVNNSCSKDICRSDVNIRTFNQKCFVVSKLWIPIHLEWMIQHANNAYSLQNNWNEHMFTFVTVPFLGEDSEGHKLPINMLCIMRNKIRATKLLFYSFDLSCLHETVLKHNSLYLSLLYLYTLAYYLFTASWTTWVVFKISKMSRTRVLWDLGNLKALGYSTQVLWVH